MERTADVAVFLARYAISYARFLWLKLTGYVNFREIEQHLIDWAPYGEYHVCDRCGGARR